MPLQRGRGIFLYAGIFLYTEEKQRRIYTEEEFSFKQQAQQLRTGGFCILY